MEKLCYIYIYEFKCLKDVELVVDTRYDYKFDRKNKRLSINRNNLPDNFWGSGITSLSAIFGNNGAGKSTAIEFILQAIINAGGSDPVNGIVVYTINEEWHAYDFDKKNPLTVDIKIKGENKEVDTDADLPDINTFFYTGHYVADYSYAKIQTVDLQGFHNASDGCLLRSDIEKFANTIDPYLGLSLGSHLTSHMSQNNYRICRLLFYERLRNAFPEFNYPQYILLAPNYGGYNGLKLDPIRRDNVIKEVKDFIELPTKTNFIDFRNQVLAQFVHFNILNATSESHLLGADSTVIKRWYDFFVPSKETLPQLEAFAKAQNEEDKRVLYKILEILSRMNSLTLFNEKTGVFYIDAFKSTDTTEKFVEEVFNSSFFITSRFFDVYYSHDKDGAGSTLSSGEQKMLDLFSRLYAAIELDPKKFSNLSSPNMLILDEVEIGFHPEWQRSFIKTLLEFLHSLYVVGGFKYQIILTSHSPILLSDIPACCCNFLKRDYVKKVTTNLRETHEETFASNVFDLYRDSFFLEKGLIGTFAEDRLRKLQEKINGGVSDVKVEIDMIGDPRLKAYFTYLLEKNLLKPNDKEAAIRYYRSKLRELGED